jgi:hypothetical protein
MARVTGTELFRQMRDLAGHLASVAGRLTGAVATVDDPTPPPRPKSSRSPGDTLGRAAPQ